jgi:hypothetical protein
MGTRSPNQAKATRVARELMKSFDLGDLYGLISEHLTTPDTERLYEAVEPRCGTSKKDASNFTSWNAVKTEERNRLSGDYSDNWVEQCSIRKWGGSTWDTPQPCRFFGNSPAIN